MKYSKSSYPIGATWELIEGRRIGRIWLAEISVYGWEIWKWSVVYNDGSGSKFDWATSYAACKRHIAISGRFKRVK